MARKFILPSALGKQQKRFALYLGLGYLVVCTLYILVSGEVALRVAQTPDQLATIERVKGVAFVVFSSVLFYLIAHTLLNRIMRQEAELTDQRRALLEAETRAAAGIMAASVAHDIKNVLTLFNFQIYRLDRARTQPVDQTRVVQEMGEAVERLNGLAMRLLALSRNGLSEPPVSADLVTIVQENVEFMRLHQVVRTCKLEMQATEPIVMDVHRGLIDQMMLNLILNAAEAVHGHGTIRVVLHNEFGDAIIEVHDSGKGIDQAVLKVLFDAFYTTKPSGHGLGLYTVKACAELHHGQVSVLSSPLGGACFRVRLPIARETSSHTAFAAVAPLSAPSP